VAQAELAPQLLGLVLLTPEAPLLASGVVNSICKYCQN